jgi:hypothetical protein
MRDYRIRKGITKRPGSKGERRHGTRSCYNAGCREDGCVAANRDFQRGYMRLYRQGIPWKDELA